MPHNEAAAELTRLRAMCDELAGAVEPFVGHVGKCGSIVTLTIGADKWTGTLTTVHFEALRTAHAKYQQEQGR